MGRVAEWAGDAAWEHVDGCDEGGEVGVDGVDVRRCSGRLRCLRCGFFEWGDLDWRLGVLMRFSCLGGAT